jgi:phosphonoacetate hydrolase
MDEWYGEGAARVILPITDPYVVHHGALGSFATAYLTDKVSETEVIERLSALKGIEVVLNNKDACTRFELPEDRVGDIVIISTENKVLGTNASRHDLTALEVPLRSHGGLTEQVVPFIVNRVLPDMPNAPELRNFDAYYYVAKAAAL